MAFSRTLMVVMMVLLAAGFGFAGGEKEKASTGQDEPVTIDYAFWGNPDAIGVEEEILEVYHSMQDRVNVAPVVSGYGGYHDMLLTQLAGGSGPDVMRVDSYYFADFAELGALRPIDDLVERDDIEMDAYYQLGVEANTLNNQLYGLPWATAPLYMFINLDVFEAQGVEIPDADWTLEDFERIARELTTEDTYGFGMTTVNTSQILPFIWAAGGSLFSDDLSDFTLDGENSIAALERLASLADDGVIPEDGIVGSADLLSQMFVNNELAMRMGSTAEILTTQEAGARFEVMNMPTGESTETTVNKSNIVGINSNSEHVEAAWDFLKFLRGPNAQGEELYVSNKRTAPNVNRAELWDMYVEASEYPSDVQAATEAINQSYGRRMPLRQGWLQIEELVMPEIQGILIGEVSAQEAINGIAQEAQRILDQ